jgi:putative heme iron utilization protein
MNSTISTPFLSQETVSISFLADVCSDVFGLFVVRMYVNQLL